MEVLLCRHWIAGCIAVGEKVPESEEHNQPEDKPGDPLDRISLLAGCRLIAGHCVVSLGFGVGVGPCTFAFMAPMLGVTLGVAGARLLLTGLKHRGLPSPIPEYLHVGGWQMLNVASIADNLIMGRAGGARTEHGRDPWTRRGALR